MKHLFLLLLVPVYFSCQEPGKKDLPPTQEESVKIAAVLSQIAYCPFPARSLEKYLPGWKLAWNPEPVGGNYAFAATNGKIYAVGIRGSLLQFNWDAFQNWFYQDLNIATAKKWEYTNGFGNARVATGSYEGWNNIAGMTDKITGQTLFAFLDSATKKETQVILTGHSLGGNLATVLASQLWQQFKNEGKERKNLNVITFGAPAAGNQSFAEDFDLKFPDALRFENSHDPAAKYPCAGKISGLGNLFEPAPAASKATVNYKNISVTLSRVFTLLELALKAIELSNGGLKYVQAGGNEEIFSWPLSGQNTNHTMEDWLKEAYFHHSMEQYAKSQNAVIVNCNE